MEHYEGIIRKVEVGENDTLYIEFTTFMGMGKTEKIAISTEHLIKKLLLNEKIGMLIWQGKHDDKIEDVVSIRGVGKDIPLLARY